MKVYGVKNDHIAPGFSPAITLHYDPVTTILRVDAVITAGLNKPPLETGETVEPGVFHTSAEVNIGELRLRNDWCEHQTYFLSSKTSVEAGFQFAPLFPLFVETLPTRESASTFANRTDQNLLVGINIPFTDSTADDIFITVNLNMNAAESDFVCGPGLERIWSEFSSSGNERTMKFPTIVAVAPATTSVDSTFKVDIRIEDAAGNLIERDATIYVEAVHGVVPGTRIKLTSGTASLPVSAFGLNAGDDVRVKLGWKYFPGAEDVIVKVI
jgi:hypothetical protein